MSFHQFTTETGESYGSFEVFKSSDFVEDELPELVGWYWQSCFPGCMPDGEPVGPFDSETAAIAHADPYRTES